jgi:23S rRNA (cytidine1920-2'-O)/16S rRNA (cytidine1409-2'-O)-methyltransferase
MIDAYRVQVNGSFATKASRLVDSGDSIEVVGDAPRFVGRGGEKLEGALDAFGLDVEGLRCVDAGASTGGFTDCLLQRGAAEVVAIDVGYGQLHERLVADHRVRSLERTNVRDLSAFDVGGPVDVLVADLSFISLCTVMASLVGLCNEGADLVVLVKPQFEAGREEASRGRGVIRDPLVWRRVLEEVRTCAASEGAALRGCTVSPLRGGDGNVEFLFHLRLGSEPRAVDLDEIVASVGEH